MAIEVAMKLQYKIPWILGCVCAASGWGCCPQSSNESACLSSEKVLGPGMTLETIVRRVSRAYGKGGIGTTFRCKPGRYVVVQGRRTDTLLVVQLDSTERSSSYRLLVRPKGAQV